MGPKRVQSHPHVERNGAAARVRRKSGPGRRTNAWHRLSGIAFVLGFSLLMVFCYDFITQHDYFGAETIVVQGNEHLEPETVIRQGGVHIGINLLSVNLSRCRRRLLAHPWIAEAEVSRDLPHELRIRVQEHQPLAILALKAPFILNRKGRIFKQWMPGDPKALPRVSGLGYLDIDVGGAGASPAFEAVMDLLRLGGRAGAVVPNSLIQEIRVDRDTGLSLYTSAWVREIRLGFDNYPRKYQGLKKVLLDLKKRAISRIESVDINDMERIVVNPVKSKSLARDDKEV